MVQMLPLRALAHPIWNSVETALGHPVAGGISVDPGASVIALGQYLSVIAVAFLSAAVAVDRQRAEWILFALTAAVTAIALIMLTYDLCFPGAWACHIRASAGYRLRGYGNNYCQRGLHPHHRAVREPPLKPTAIGAGFTADLRSLQRSAGDL